MQSTIEKIVDSNNKYINQLKARIKQTSELCSFGSELIYPDEKNLIIMSSKHNIGGKLYRGIILPQNKNVTIKFCLNDDACISELQNYFSIGKHNNILNIIGYTFMQFRSILIFDSVHKTLRDFLKEQKTINLKLSLTKGLNILYGLQALHNKGIIYGDLRPDNILLDENNNIYLSDFGIKLEELLYTDPLQRYYPPELAINNEQSSLKTDIFMFGFTLYEMITLTEIFPSLNSEQCKQKIYLGERPNLDVNLICTSAIHKSPSENLFHSLSLITLIKKCLDQNPNNRPDVKILIEELVLLCNFL